MTVLASDAHGGDRMPSLRPAIRALETAGEHGAAALAGETPRALLEHGLELPPARMVA